MSDVIRLFPSPRIDSDATVFVMNPDEPPPAPHESENAQWVWPLEAWLTMDPLLQRQCGVWLSGEQDVSLLAPFIDTLPLVALHFPAFKDGRGYSQAVLLRQRYGFKGELRAFGEVLRDQFYYMARCGFDVLQPPEGRYSPEKQQEALKSLEDFTEPYQGSVRIPEPLFRRVARPVPLDALTTEA